MRMLRRGQVTVREAAIMADVSRQRVLVWCEQVGIDPAEARKAWLAAVLDRLNRAR